MPSNITEYLFCDDRGTLTTSEEAVKSLSHDFTNIMKGVYFEMQEKYESTLKAIVQDNEMDSVDFPLIANRVSVTNLATLVGPELAEKLHLSKNDENEFKDKEDIEKSNNEQQST